MFDVVSVGCGVVSSKEGVKGDRLCCESLIIPGNRLVQADCHFDSDAEI